MATQTLKLATVYPSDPAKRQACADCLRERLLNTAGVRGVKIHNADGPGAAVELDYDPRLIPLNELDAEMRRAGVCCEVTRAQIVLGIEGMVSKRSEHLIEAALGKLPGVVASASFPSRSLRVEFDRTQCALPEIARRLDDLGLRIRSGTESSAKTQVDGNKARTGARDDVMAKIARFFADNPQMATAVVGLFLLIGA